MGQLAEKSEQENRSYTWLYKFGIKMIVRVKVGASGRIKVHKKRHVLSKETVKLLISLERRDFYWGIEIKD